MEDEKQQKLVKFLLLLLGVLVVFICLLQMFSKFGEQLVSWLDEGFKDKIPPSAPISKCDHINCKDKGCLCDCHINTKVQPTQAGPKPKIMTKEVTEVSPVDLNARQKKIYKMLKSKQNLEMKEIAAKVSGVSTRTLRRDMTKLEDLGLVRQDGKTRDRVYRLV